MVWIIPVALLLMLVAITRIDIFYLLLLLFVPLSVQLRFILPDTPADLFLPTEPMLLVILIIMFFKIFRSRETDSNLLRNPVASVIILMLLWMFITSVTSLSPIISLKVLLTRIWFIAGFYYLSLHLFKRDGFMEKSIKVLIIGLIPVILYNTVRLGAVGLFNQQAANTTVWPFFNDHTSFGAAIAFMIPASIYFIAKGEGAGNRLIWTAISLVLLFGLLLSYSRAAWLSLIISSLFASVLLLRIPWKISATAVAAIVVALLFSWSSLVSFLQDNRQDSSADLADHVRSAANITSDASNLERINRWKAALRMISEKPLLGWGPGTYQFNYASYQLNSERTIISTNFGNRGNAHSEYIGAAVDSGVPGTLVYLLLLAVSVITGARYCYRYRDRNDRLLMIAMLTGLFTYVIHGFLNNFLDTDKISAPFWISIAIIVTLTESKGYKKTPD